MSSPDLTTATVEERVKRVIVKLMDLNEGEAEEVVREASLDANLGFDSVDIPELVLELEEEFSVEISEEDQQKFTTVGAIVDYLKEK